MSCPLLAEAHQSPGRAVVELLIGARDVPARSWYEHAGRIKIPQRFARNRCAAAGTSRAPAKCKAGSLTSTRSHKQPLSVRQWVRRICST